MTEGVRESAIAWLTIPTCPRVGWGIGTAMPKCSNCGSRNVLSTQDIGTARAPGPPLRAAECLVHAVDRPRRYAGGVELLHQLAAAETTGEFAQFGVE